MSAVYFVLISIVTYAAPLSSGAAGGWEDFSVAAFGGVFFGLLVALIFTPCEVAWDDDGIRINAIFPGSGDYDWSQLEAYSPFARGLFLIKFEGKQAFQIYPEGFRAVDWKSFQQFLRQRFPEKKTWVWAGPLPLPLPLRFGNRKI